ncbi:MAG: nicotinamide-nucleotide adenylyltransferase [archaeon GBS-70-058]|nr:nicotinamide-nucleotide adenylyltransferase [Candidatus Culexarchaeum nevadense]
MCNCSRGLYVGRFQPFHNGHLECVKYVLGKCKEIIIVVGSAQASHTFENPFTAGERIEMIRLALQESGIDLSKCIIIPVEDTLNNNHSIWVSKVRSMTPKFDVVFSNSPLTRKLFEEEGFKVEGLPYINREHYSGKNIRKLIVSGEDWRKFVPRSVYDYIKLIKGEERLRDLSKRDYACQSF